MIQLEGHCECCSLAQNEDLGGTARTLRQQDTKTIDYRPTLRCMAALNRKLKMTTNQSDDTHRSLGKWEGIHIYKIAKGGKMEDSKQEGRRQMTLTGGNKRTE
jgi:hypothetical protein